MDVGKETHAHVESFTHMLIMPAKFDYWQRKLIKHVTNMQYKHTGKLTG